MKNVISRSLLLIFLLVFNNLIVAQSVDVDIQLGKENAQMVESQMGIYDNAKMTAYIDKIGQKLVASLDNPLFPYTFRLVPDMAPNAFALPGGQVFVTTGILPLLESEDELACIMGHEIIHSNNRHGIKQIKKSIVPRLFELPGNLLGVINKDLGALFNAPIETSNKLLFASYSRRYETEADEVGVTLAAKAGYNPRAMISILSRMSTAIEEATGYKEEKSYFADHPYSPTRNKNVEELSNEIMIGPSNPISNSLIKEFDGVLFGNSPSKGVVKENTFFHPDLDFFVEFPKDWTIDNQPTNVGAYHPDRNAAVFVSLEEPNLTPEQAGKAFLADLKSEYKSKLTNAETYNFNGKKGYLTSFTEKQKGQTMYAYVLWLPLNKMVFKFIGITPIEHREKLEKSANSLRVLTTTEKNNVMETYLNVVTALQNETLEDLSKRTDNKLKLELTAIINDHNKNDRLSEGELIKIVSERKYLKN